MGTSRPPETFADLIECGYTSDEVRDTLNVECMLKEDNVVQTTQEDFNCHRSTIRKKWKDMKIMFKRQTDRVIWYRVQFQPPYLH